MACTQGQTTPPRSATLRLARTTFCGVLLVGLPTVGHITEASGTAQARIPSAMAPVGPFVNVAHDLGLRTPNASGGLEKRYLVETPGTGAAWIDFDRDGRIDLFLPNGHGGRYVDYEDGSSRLRVDRRPPDELYRQSVERGFEEVGLDAGVAATGWAAGATTGDIDNDGWPDLYVTQLGSNVLYRNNGDGSFSDITDAARADDARWSNSAAFADLDGNGFFDLYVTNYVRFDLDDPPFDGKDICTFNGVSGSCGPVMFEHDSDLLLWGGVEDPGAGIRFRRQDQREILNAAYAGLGVMPIDIERWFFAAHTGRDSII